MSKFGYLCIGILFDIGILDLGFYYISLLPANALESVISSA